MSHLDPWLSNLYPFFTRGILRDPSHPSEEAGQLWAELPSEGASPRLQEGSEPRTVLPGTAATAGHDVTVGAVLTGRVGVPGVV